MTVQEAVSALRAYAEGYAGNIRGMCALAADLLESNVPRWISVEERLPEAHRKVLVYSDNPVLYWNVWVDYMDDSGWSCIVDSEWHVVTHWMPLPEPPKEETP